MASYTDLIRKITTAEINRVQREGAYERWSYFVDGRTGKAGVIFANATTFAAYEVTDSPDPKLVEFGREQCSDLVLTPNPEYLVLTAGENTFRASVFPDPLMLIDDEFTDAYTNDTVQSWQRFLHDHGVQLAHRPAYQQIGPMLTIGVIAVLIVVFLVIALT